MQDLYHQSYQHPPTTLKQGHVIYTMGILDSRIGGVLFFWAPQGSGHGPLRKLPGHLWLHVALGVCHGHEAGRQGLAGCEPQLHQGWKQIASSTI